MEERLQKRIAESGYTSRRNAEKLIQEGKVLVNGEIVTKLGKKKTEKDEIIVDGEFLETQKFEYYLLNKPRGIISSSSDEKGRKTVVDLIETQSRVYPVGRLDYDTTGLILLTNDGELTNLLTHPKSKVPKTYLAKINKVLTMEEYHKIKEGIVIDGRKVKVKSVKIKIDNECKIPEEEKNHKICENQNICNEKGICIKNNTSFVEITIIEGRNHIVKRIFESLGIDVIKLTRTNYAFLDLGTLRSYEYRTLTKDEVARLYNYVRNK